ncbi:MAG TPA: hypothetical protein VGC24_01565 [Burkholderiaceae bacterium]
MGVGFRSTGCARSFPDLDLLPDTAQSLNWNHRTILANTLKQNAHPLRVDIADAGNLANDAMRQQIEPAGQTNAVFGGRNGIFNFTRLWLIYFFSVEVLHT